MTKRIKTTVMIILVIVMVLSMVACAQTKEVAPVETESAAKEADAVEPEEAEQAPEEVEETDAVEAGGELVVYGWAGNWDLWFKDWGDEFEQQYGITIKYISGPGTQMRQRIVAEDAAKSDVFISTPADAFTLSANGFLADIPWDQLENAKDVDDKFKFPQVGIWGYDLQMLAYNTDFVTADEAPKTWKELSDAKWEGKIGLWAPTVDNSTQHLMVMIEKYGEEEAFKLIADQYENAGVVYDTSGKSESTIATGQTYVNTVSMGGANVAIEQAGGKVAVVIPEEGPFLMLNSMSVMKNAPNMDAALKFVDFYLSKERQNNIMNELGISIAVNGTVELTNEAISKTMGDISFTEMLKTAYVPDWAHWIKKDDQGVTNLELLMSKLEETVKK